MSVYLSGPIKLDRERAERRFGQAVEIAKLLGYSDIVNPFDIKPICTCGLSIEADTFEEPTDDHYNCLMRGDIAAMMHCDTVLMLPLWQQSKGAQIERNIAQMVGIPVLELLNEVGNGMTPTPSH